VYTRHVQSALLVLLATGCGSGYQAPAYEPSTPTPEEAEWDRLHALEEAGSSDEALAGYERLCGGDPAYPRACYDLSRLLFELERYDEARQASLAFVTRFPEHALVQPAVKRLSRHFAEQPRIAAGVGVLTDLAAGVKGTDAEDTVIYEIARLHREAGDTDAEVRALRRVIKMGRWQSQLWNDSIWRLIEIRGEQGDKAAEERLLEEVLEARESSWLIGSYTQGIQDDAMLRLGRLRLEDGRVEAAYDLFIELSEWETSRARDDGLLWAAKTRLSQGRTKEACKLLLRLLKKMPDASSHREAAELQLSIGCSE
jgi:tetratricopeptide (TPR) repeat protein